MALEPGMFYGRGEPSTRVFRKGDTIYDHTMDNKWTFVREIPLATIEAEGGLAYRRYVTHPVSIGQGRIFGVLTVDGIEAGDLDRVVDVPMIAVLSSLVALTYQFENR